MKHYIFVALMAAGLGTASNAFSYESEHEGNGSSEMNGGSMSVEVESPSFDTGDLAGPGSAEDDRMGTAAAAAAGASGSVNTGHTALGHHGNEVDPAVDAGLFNRD